MHDKSDILQPKVLQQGHNGGGVQISGGVTALQGRADHTNVV
jgi:hypothetical protein